MGLDAIALVVACLTTDGVVWFRSIEAIVWTRLMIGKLSALLEYVLTGNFTVRGAGVSLGGIRVICERLTGTHPVEGATLIDFSAVVDVGGGIDFLIKTTFDLVRFGWPFVVGIFTALTTLFKPGTGRNVGFGVMDTDGADLSTTFCEFIRCTLIKPPFGALICCVGSFGFCMSGFGNSLGSFAYGKDNRLAII